MLNVIRLSMVAGLGAALLGACSGGDGGGAGGGAAQTLAQACQQGCDKAATLKCPGDPAVSECVTQCKSSFPAACEGKFVAYSNCATGRPTSDWLCDTSGNADLKSGVCSAEFDAAVACTLANLDGGGAD